MWTFLGMDLVSWVLQIVATALSVWGIELNRRKKKMCWWVWITGNWFWLALFIYSHLWISIIQVALYQIYNYAAWRTWKKDEEVSHE